MHYCQPRRKKIIFNQEIKHINPHAMQIFIRRHDSILIPVTLHINSMICSICFKSSITNEYVRYHHQNVYTLNRIYQYIQNKRKE